MAPPPAPLPVLRAACSPYFPATRQALCEAPCSDRLEGNSYSDSARLLVALHDYLDRHPAGHVLPSPADISWSDDTLVQPDVFVVALEEARTLDWRQMKTLLLAVEVLSPSTARADRFTKRRLYQERGVPTYWIVDPDRRCVEVWTPEATFPAIEWEAVSWQPAGADQALTVRLEELFRAV